LLPEYLADVIDWILAETGIEVIVTRDGEIMAQHKPQEAE